jgi:C4-dicarboxylate transporter DctM subunit
MINRLASLAGYGAGGALLLVALVIMIDVLLRWTLSAPIKGLFEVSELVFAAIMSLAFADANYRRAHVSMELVGTLTRRVAGIMVVAHLMTAITFYGCQACCVDEPESG